MSRETFLKNCGCVTLATETSDLFKSFLMFRTTLKDSTSTLKLSRDKSCTFKHSNVHRKRLAAVCVAECLLLISRPGRGRELLKTETNTSAISHSLTHSLSNRKHLAAGALHREVNLGVCWKAAALGFLPAGSLMVLAWRPRQTETGGFSPHKTDHYDHWWRWIPN